MRLAARRVPLLVVGLLSMMFGMWLGLVRLGWNLPLPWQDQLIAHGPLMVCGFLGTSSASSARAVPERWSSCSANFTRTAFGPDFANPATVPAALHCEPARGSMLET